MATDLVDIVCERNTGNGSKPQQLVLDPRVTPELQALEMRPVTAAKRSPRRSPSHSLVFSGYVLRRACIDDPPFT